MENRMKSGKFAIIVFCVVCTSVLGETVRFDPPSQSFDIGSGASTLSFDLYIESTSTTATLDSVDMLIGSNTLAVTQVTLSTEFLTATDGFNTNSRFDGTAGYDSAIFAGGFSFTPLTKPFLLGTVTVDASNLSVGLYTVDVNNDTDGGISSVALGGVKESLTGRATVTIFTATTSTCQFDTDCDDTLDCTADFCVSGTCNHTPIDGCGDSSTPPADDGGTTDTGGSDTTGGTDTTGDSTGGTTDTGGTDSTNGGLQVPLLCGATGMIPLIFTLFFLTLLKRKTL